MCINLLGKRRKTFLERKKKNARKWPDVVNMRKSKENDAVNSNWNCKAIKKKKCRKLKEV